MRVFSEALAKEEGCFGGLRRNVGATGSCPWGSTIAVLTGFLSRHRNTNTLTQEEELYGKTEATQHSRHLGG
jgi:hypothetical protein